METAHQNEVHAFTGLFPGDYFIHEFELDGQSFFAYGLLRQIEGREYHADYQCSGWESRPETVEKEEHRIVGRISRRSYELARLRGWPNTRVGVEAVIDHSAGEKIRLSLGERFRLLFIR